MLPAGRRVPLCWFGLRVAQQSCSAGSLAYPYGAPLCRASVICLARHAASVACISLAICYVAARRKRARGAVWRGQHAAAGRGAPCCGHSALLGACPPACCPSCSPCAAKALPCLHSGRPLLPAADAHARPAHPPPQPAAGACPPTAPRVLLVCGADVLHSMADPTMWRQDLLEARGCHCFHIGLPWGLGAIWFLVFVVSLACSSHKSRTCFHCAAPAAPLPAARLGCSGLQAPKGSCSGRLQLHRLPVQRRPSLPHLPTPPPLAACMPVQTLLRNHGVVCISRTGSDTAHLLDQPGTLLNMYRCAWTNPPGCKKRGAECLAGGTSALITTAAAQRSRAVQPPCPRDGCTRLRDPRSGPVLHLQAQRDCGGGAGAKRNLLLTGAPSVALLLVCSILLPRVCSGLLPSRLLCVRMRGSACLRAPAGA